MTLRKGKAGRWQARGIILTAIAVMVAAVWFVSQAQREASREGANDVQNAQTLLTNRLDMETGLRGFMLTGKEAFLDPYRSGLSGFRATMADARGAGRNTGLLDSQETLTAEWVGLTKTGIAERRRGDSLNPEDLLARKRLMDEFRVVNDRYAQVVQESSDERQSEARTIAILLTGALGLLGLLIGYVAIERPAARRARQRADVAEFSQMLQFAATEREAQSLVRRQLERAIPDCHAVVLTINNSENRLQPATELTEDSAFANALRTASPSSCLAVRRGQQYERGTEREPLIDCELCGARGASSVCTPALVGGEIMGSVLVVREHGAMTGKEAEQIENTTSLAAPVLGNLRNLAIAETRAVTDALTGLPNSRSATETLGVMAAYAGRSGNPLSGILVDLDHFKKVNDNYGHQVGDDVLAAAAKSLRDTLRASDFVARYGGEEFLILLQGTSKAEAATAAEKMRRQLAYIRVPGFAARVTASFGVASIPEDAGDGESLLKAADEALYSAKDTGRDRVVVHAGANGAASAAAGPGDPPRTGLPASRGGTPSPS